MVRKNKFFKFLKDAFLTEVVPQDVKTELKYYKPPLNFTMSKLDLY